MTCLEVFEDVDTIKIRVINQSLSQFKMDTKCIYMV